MKKPSRHMPEIPTQKMRSLEYVVFIVLLLGLGCLCYLVPVIGILVIALTVIVPIVWFIERRRLRRIAQSRHEEGICEFARSFNRRQTDPWIIRAVYEGLQDYLKGEVDHFPIRPTDRIDEDLHIDRDDLDDIAEDIATRAGYEMTHTKNNPLYDNVKTVGDMVSFFCYQPKKADAEAVH